MSFPSGLDPNAIDLPCLQPSGTVHGVQLRLLELELFLLSPELHIGLNTLLDQSLLVVMVAVILVRLVVLGRLVVLRRLVALRRLVILGWVGLGVPRRSRGGFTALGVVVPVVTYDVTE